MARRFELYEVETGRSLGAIAEVQRQQLIDLLEEESEEDRDYWIDEPTLEMLAEHGVDQELVERLRTALAGREGFDVAWRELA
jgi:hypothetical protein